MQREVEELRASRRRLVLAGDAERHRVERALHEGVQQDLVALAVNLQLAGALVDSDPAGAKELVEETARDVRQSLEETARLAQRIHPPLVEWGDVGAALRAAAASLGIHASIEVAAGNECAPEALRAVYRCCVEALERVGQDGRATIAIRAEEGAVVFEVTARTHAVLDHLRDHVEALGGRLAIDSAPDGSVRMTGSL